MRSCKKPSLLAANRARGADAEHSVPIAKLEAGDCPSHTQVRTFTLTGTPMRFFRLT